MLDRWLHGREESLHLMRVFESHLAGLLKIMAREGRWPGLPSPRGL